MPVELDACVQDVMKQGHDESSAFAICNSQLGGSNFVSYTLDNKGDLYLKYFLADATIAKNTAVGDFSLNGAAIRSTAKHAIGLPFSILPNKELSLFGDYHPWDPNENATWDDHVKFAEKYAPGHLVAVTPTTELQGAAPQEIMHNSGEFAVIKVDDIRARDAYINNPSLIPKAVSPGIMNLEAPNKTDIKNFKWTHLAAVPTGAYGDKATLYASCLGGKECVNKLIAAGVKQKDSQITYCPVGASEFLSSLVSSTSNPSQMSDNANTVPNATPPTATAVQSTSTTAAPAQTGALTTAQPSTPQPIIRLKGSVPNAQQQPNIDQKEFQKVKMQLEELQQAKAQADLRNRLQKVIPIDLFRINGKINEEAYNKEIEKRLKEGWTEEHFPTLQEYYDMQGQILQLKAQTGGNPLGGSATYQTPSQVPAEPTGAGTVDVVAQKTKSLFAMWGLNR